MKPLDADVLCEAAAGAGRLLTVEESALAGGYGAACLEALAERRLLRHVEVSRLGLPDAFVPHGDAGRQLAAAGVDAAGIAAAARRLVGAAASHPAPRERVDAPSRAAG